MRGEIKSAGKCSERERDCGKEMMHSRKEKIKCELERALTHERGKSERERKREREKEECSSMQQEKQQQLPQLRRARLFSTSTPKCTT